MENAIRELRTERGAVAGAAGRGDRGLAADDQLDRRGRYTPSLPLALALARYFGRTVEEMFDDDQLHALGRSGSCPLFSVVLGVDLPRRVLDRRRPRLRAVLARRDGRRSAGLILPRRAQRDGPRPPRRRTRRVLGADRQPRDALTGNVAIRLIIGMCVWEWAHGRTARRTCSSARSAVWSTSRRSPWPLARADGPATPPGRGTVSGSEDGPSAASRRIIGWRRDCAAGHIPALLKARGGRDRRESPMRYPAAPGRARAEQSPRGVRRSRPRGRLHRRARPSSRAARARGRDRPS